MKGWMWLLPLMVVMFGMVVTQSTQDAFWFDEALSIRMSGGAPFGPYAPDQIITNVAEDRAWPPLSNLALALWGNFVGWSELSGRYLSALFGLLSVALMAQVGRQFNRNAPYSGLVSACLLVGSAFFVYYWHEMRGYTLYVCITLACVLFYWRLYTRPHATPISYALFTLSLIALCYTHYIATITALSIGLFHLLHLKTRHAWLILACLCLGALAFLPWVGSALLAVQTEISMIRGLDLPTIASVSLYVFGNGIALIPIGILVTSAIYIRQREVAFLWWWLLSAIVFIGLFNHVTEFLFHPRHIIILLLPLLLLASVVIQHWQAHPYRRWIAQGALLMWLILGIYQGLSPNFMAVVPRQMTKLPRDTVRVAQQIVQNCASPNDTLIFYTDTPDKEWQNERVLQHYLATYPQRYALVDGMINLQYEDSLQLGFQYDRRGDWQTRLNTLIDGAPTVWYIVLPQVATIPHKTEFETTIQTRYPTTTNLLTSNVLDVRAYSTAPINCSLP